MPRTLHTYTQEDIAERLKDHPGWTYGDDGMLHAEFTLKNFQQVMMVVNAVALLAETANHHPDLLIHAYKKLSIRLMTHDPQGITDLDFALVAQIDALPRFS